ncbi:SNF2 family N-terminal domain-containing protein [Dactylonectria estremocensis]|uniref:SNF2 family N-terminal domain-containing protein n=1 Tax=Dactylonectria estremocensis TaxID=1079267 RepID=A0A9P9FDY4_9HYPO|nr:SNF2 family N-terminal domain-containing protein [Dactylonectria estremocensis]
MDITPPRSMEPRSLVPSQRGQESLRPLKPAIKTEPNDASVVFTTRSVIVKKEEEETLISVRRETTQFEDPPEGSSAPRSQADASASKEALTQACSEIQESSNDIGCDLFEPAGFSQRDFEYDSGTEDSADDGDPSDGEYDPSIESKSKKKKAEPKKKSSRKIFKTAREFVAHLHKTEDSDEGKKRKREMESDKPRKAKKPSKKSMVNQNSSEEISDTSSNFHGSIATPRTLPAAEPNTHAALIAQLMRDIPEGSNNRHTSTQRRDMTEAVKGFGYKRVTRAGNNALLEGMITPLYPYQLTASWWMVKRELSQTAPYGGILADVMGLGKTVVSLNTIKGNPPTNPMKKEFSNATLVVVPNKDVALQWLSEIDKHCEGDTTAIIYSKEGGNKAARWKSFDIVITTYFELIKQYLSKDKIRGLKEKHDSDIFLFEKEKKSKLGVLFQIKWYRVILDEAHQIKQSDSCSANSCWELQSLYRWALSGTPLANNSTEFYPYLRFLQCNFTGERKEYNRKYASKDSTDGAFDTLVNHVMYRRYVHSQIQPPFVFILLNEARTMQDKFLGNAMLKLPDSESHDIWVPLSKEETTIYKFVDEYFAGLVKKTEVKKEEEEEDNEDDDEEEDNEEDDEKDDGKEEDDDEEEEEIAENSDDEENRDENIGEKKSAAKIQWSRLLRLRQTVSHPFNLESMLLEEKGLSLEKITTLKTNLSDLVTLSITQQLQKGDQYADENEYRAKARNCGFCAMPVFKPVQSENCVLTAQRFARQLKQPQHLECQQLGCSARVAPGKRMITLSCVKANAAKDHEFEEASRNKNNVQLSSKEKTSKKKASKEKASKKKPNSFFVASCLEETGVKMPPSSKLTAAMAVILTWSTVAPEDKIIVFVEFIPTAKVLGRMLAAVGLSCVCYNSEPGPKQKSKALESFKDVNGPQVLNRTREDQAFSRVFRNGQNKKTHLVRILTEGGIDERLVMLQDVKSKDVNRALQDDNHTPVKLSAKELNELFTPAPEPEKNTKSRKGKDVAK